MNTTKTIWFVLGILAIGAIVMVSHQLRSVAPVTSSQSNTTLHVVASFYPLAYFAEQIGGDLVQVTTVTPPGAEPHEFEPTPRDMMQIEDADVIVLNGGNFESWGSDVQKSVDPKKTTVVMAGDGLADLKFEEEGQTMSDPHMWLAPLLVTQMTKKITAAFIQKDPAHAAEYEQRSAQLQLQLTTLDSEYRSGLMHCERKDFVTSHAAFGYLARAYGLNQVSITGLSPEAEPSAQQLASTADFVRSRGIRVIFFETLVSPALSDTLAKEVGAQTLVLDPIEGLTKGEVTAGATYLTKMRTNLANLRIALTCK